MLRRVAEERRAGLPVAQALAESGALPSSALRSVRSLLPDLEPATVSVASMVAVSRAIEDAAVERPGPSVLIGAFQRPAVWQRSARRWRRIAPSTLVTLALAPGLPARVDGHLWTAPIPPALELADEWVVICDGPTVSAFVVARERPTGTPRWFDAVWSTDPHLVRHIARSVWMRLRPAGDPAAARAVKARLDAVAEPTRDAGRASTELSTQVLARLGGDRS